MTRFILHFMLMAMLLGCAVPPARISVEKSRQYTTKYDIIWESIVSWCMQNEFIIDSIDKSSGLIVLTYRTCPIEWADCGDPGWELKWMYDPVGTFNITVSTESDENATIQVNSSFVRQCYRKHADKMAEKLCYTTGVFEAMFLNQIERFIERN